MFRVNSSSYLPFFSSQLVLIPCSLQCFLFLCFSWKINKTKMLEDNNACRANTPLTTVTLHKKRAQRAADSVSPSAPCSPGMSPLSVLSNSPETRQESNKVMRNISLTVTPSFRASLPIQVISLCVLLSQPHKRETELPAPILIRAPTKTVTADNYRCPSLDKRC